MAERPDAVLVMAPPVIAALPVWLYSRLTRIPYGIDAHTAAFLHPRWSRLQWLQHAISRAAATTIVTNEHLATALRSTGAHVTIMRDVPVEFPRHVPFPLDEGHFSVAAVCSFNDDEPVPAILEAAARLPDVRFYLTGDPRRLAPELRAALPSNVRLTGFLPDGQYGFLVAHAGVVLTLTTRNHTMLRGAYEAIYQGTPVIVSDWPLLRDAFQRGAVHVDNTPEAIASAVSTIAADAEAYRAGARELRQQKLAIWNTVRAALLTRLTPTTQ
jgi:glycosyltransferase involved in cell wall biosynthesis